MKMDAMQKRRMWKVAAIHLSFSLLTIVGILYPGFYFGDFLFLSIEFWFKVGMLLQPFCYSLAMFFLVVVDNGSEIPLWIQFLSMLICILLWSLCFGWLYTKLVSLLNRDSVLGKKVF
jgi:hypothetical protein